MEKIELNQGELEAFKEIGFGACSTVYNDQKGNAIKILNESGLKMINIDELQNLADVQISTYTFPQKLVFIDGAVAGYTMQYVNGKNIGDVIRQIDIDVLKDALDKANNGLQMASEELIISEDLNSGGIMWDEENQEIRIIDVDFFKKAKQSNPKDCYNHNLSEFNMVLKLELGISPGQQNELMNFLQSSKDYSDFDYQATVASFLGENSPLMTDYIDKIVEVFEKEFGFSPRNFDEIYSNIIEKYGKLQEDTTLSESAFISDEDFFEVAMISMQEKEKTFRDLEEATSLDIETQEKSREE